PHRFAPVLLLGQGREVGLDPDAVIAERAGDPPGVVGAGVVQDDELEVAVGLVEDAADGLGEELLAPVDRDAHGHARQRWHRSVVSWRPGARSCAELSWSTRAGSSSRRGPGPSKCPTLPPAR